MKESGLESMGDVTFDQIMDEIDQENAAAQEKPESLYDTESEIKIIKRFQPSQPDDDAQIKFLELNHLTLNMIKQSQQGFETPDSADNDSQEVMPVPIQNHDATSMTIEQFTKHISKNTSSIFSPTPLRELTSPKDLTPPRDKSKGKGIATKELLNKIMPYMKEGGNERLADLNAEKEKSEKSLQKIMNPDIIRAQAQKMAEYEAKRKNMLDECNHHISHRVDQLPITKISYRVNASKEASMRITIGNDPLNLTIYEKFRLKTLGLRNLIPPPDIEGLRGRIIREPDLGIFYYNGLTKYKALVSNLRRIQVKDIGKEVEDHSKTYSSAGMDISWYVEGIHCGSKESLSQLSQSAGLNKFACKLVSLPSLLVQRSGVAKYLGVAGIQQQNGLVNETNVTLFVKVLNRFEFEVKPLGDHTFEVEPQENINQGAGLQEVQTQDLIDYQLARDKEQHLACELFGYREDSNEAAFAVIVVEKIYAHASLTFNNTVASTIAENEMTTAMAITGGIDNDIYSTVDACPNACEMWKAIKRLKQGESINVQDLETNLYWEFREFTSQDGESLESYYSRSQQAATRNRGKAIVNSSQPIYDQEPSMVAEDDETSKDKEIDKLMALISLSFNKIYTPTNNNLRTSSNTSRANQDNSPRINRSVGYENQRIGNVVGAKETVGSSVVQKSRIQCYNCKEFRHVARECQKPKKAKDAAYHREKMLLYKQEEAGIQLNEEQADWRDDTDDDELEDQELEGNYMYMAQLQEISPDAANSGPVFDDEPLEEIDQNDDNNDLAKEQLARRNSKEYASQIELECAKVRGDLVSYKMDYQKSCTKYTDTINDLNQTISEMKDKHSAHQETISILSKQKEAQIKLFDIC
nr:retrovirus-related Pol polyprotein from transposon TNT 1-94 [Tanacetum cinerariifolium]